MLPVYMDIALQKLSEGCSCAAYDGKILLTSTKRGVAPLLGWLEEGRDLTGFCVADKVVGRGAAFLYLLLKVKRLHARVISKPALEVLQDVEVSYDHCVPAIRNRDNTGFCPIESAVLDCSEPDLALTLIKEKLAALNK